jgi:hypothetical protein
VSGARDSGAGLSVQTLVIASASSLVAALVVHEFWQGGAILGAAVTPVIVALVSEALRKPAEVISTRSGRTREQPAVNPPPVVTPREDKYGIWEEQRPRRRLHVKLALATGVVAFAIAAFFLTGAELVIGGASEGDRFRVVPGKQDRRDAPDRDRPPAATQEEDDALDLPEEDQPPADEEEQPEPTVPPEETAPPTTPEEAPPETVPTPDPGTTPTLP